MKIGFGRKAMSGLLAMTVCLSLGGQVLADQFTIQEEALSNDIASSRAQLDQLGQKEDTLKNKIAALGIQIKSIALQLNLNTIKLEKLTGEVVALEAQLAEQRRQLRDAVRTMQIDGGISTFEMIVSSNNVSDYLDKQQYVSSIQDKIQDAIQKIGGLEKELKKQQTDMIELTTSQKAQQQSLAAARTEQTQLLADTQNEESNYQSIVAANKRKLQDIYAERARLDALNNVTVSTGGTGGYPFANYVPDSGSDPWGGLYRECVSYVAWKRRAAGMGPFPNWWGNAKDWANATKTSSNATEGAIAVFLPGVGGAGSVGHVAFVERVNGSGTMDVSEYNWVPFSYSLRRGVSTAGVRFIR